VAPFDPTASVRSRAMRRPAVPGSRSHAIARALTFAIAAALVLLVVGFPIQAFFRRRRATLPARDRRARCATRTDRPAGQACATAAERRYAALAAQLRQRIAAVGETLDADGFSDAGASPSRASADSVLSSLRP
jgi:hypothetical protein